MRTSRGEEDHKPRLLGHDLTVDLICPPETRPRHTCPCSAYSEVEPSEIRRLVPRQITSDGGCDPSWSPDGIHLVYSRCDACVNTPESGVLWIINVDTLEERQLTSKWPEVTP